MRQWRHAARWQILIRLAKGLIAVSLLVWLLGSGRLDFSILVAAPLSALHLFCVLLVSASMLVQAVRWWWLLRIQRTNFSLWEVVQMSWIGQFFSLVLPGAAGGELARAYYITRDPCGATITGISTVLLDRAMGLYALLWLGAFSLTVLALENKLTSAVMQIGALLLALIIGASVLCLGFWFRLPRDLMLRLVPRGFREPFGATLDSYRGHSKYLFGAFVLSLLAGILMMGAFLLSSRIIGTSPGWQQILLVGPLVIVANTLPISPGGVGVAEATASGLFSQFGIETGAAIMLIVRLFSLLLRLPGGLIYVLYTKTFPSRGPMGAPQSNSECDTINSV